MTTTGSRKENPQVLHITKGNKAQFALALEYGGDLLENNASALRVVFRVFDKDGTVVIDFDNPPSTTPGDPLVVDDPAVGLVMVNLSALDTAPLEIGRYTMAIQVEHSADDVVEWTFPHFNINIIQNRID